MHKVFLDEVRSDRHWMTHLFMAITLGIALFGASLFVIALTSSGHRSVKVLAVAIIALPITIGFAVGAFILVDRWLRGPVHVRIDLRGITVGKHLTPWSSVSALVVSSSGWGDRVWVQVQCKRGHDPSFILPGAPIPWAQWDPMADRLQEHFRQTHLDIHID
jgi:hypothetical protein